MNVFSNIDALSFLYLALGGGFLLLVLFTVIAIFHVIRILKDFADASDSVKETAQKMNESVGKVTEKINEMSDQITECVAKPFALIQYIMERARPIIDMMQRKSEEWSEYGDWDGKAEKGGKEEKAPKKKRRFGGKNKF
jgi:HAMP domain-containing protein